MLDYNVLLYFQSWIVFREGIISFNFYGSTLSVQCEGYLGVFNFKTIRIYREILSKKKEIKN